MEVGGPWHAARLLATYITGMCTFHATSCCIGATLWPPHCRPVASLLLPCLSLASHTGEGKTSEGASLGTPVGPWVHGPSGRGTPISLCDGSLCVVKPGTWNARQVREGGTPPPPCKPRQRGPGASWPMLLDAERHAKKSNAKADTPFQPRQHVQRHVESVRKHLQKSNCNVLLKDQKFN